MKNILCNVTNDTEHTNMQETVRLRVAEGNAKGLKNRLDGLDFYREVFAVSRLQRACTADARVVAAELEFGPQFGELLHDILFIHNRKSIAAKTV